jgi:hypothetical protein
MNNKTDKELRHDALQLAFIHLQGKFEHMARAVGETQDAKDNAYFNLAVDYYPTADDVLEYAKRYIDFINSVE